MSRYPFLDAYTAREKRAFNDGRDYEAAATEGARLGGGGGAALGGGGALGLLLANPSLREEIKDNLVGNLDYVAAKSRKGAVGNVLKALGMVGGAGALVGGTAGTALGAAGGLAHERLRDPSLKERFFGRD